MNEKFLEKIEEILKINRQLHRLHARRLDEIEDYLSRVKEEKK